MSGWSVYTNYTVVNNYVNLYRNAIKDINQKIYPKVHKTPKVYAWSNDRSRGALNRLILLFTHNILKETNT